MATLFAALGTDLPIKALAVIGAFTLGAFAGGWVLGLVAKTVYRQQVPPWVTWLLRTLSVCRSTAMSAALAPSCCRRR